MTSQQLSDEDVRTLRQRVEYEDQLLNSRTTIILTLNGLMAIATGFTSGWIRFLAAATIMAVNILWIPFAMEARGYIHLLSTTIRKSEKAPIDEQIRIDYLRFRRRVGPTRLISIGIPIILSLGWLLGILIAVTTKTP